MLSFDQCLKANRPLIFVVAESDLELLNYVNKNYKNSNWYVYSKTIAQSFRLSLILDHKFVIENQAESLNTVLNTILIKGYDDESISRFDKFIFLDSDSYINDKQIIRKIKDIISRYQLDAKFVANLIFVSQKVCIPPELERLSEITFFDLPDMEVIKDLSERLSEGLQLSKKPSEEILNNLKGMTLFEIEQAFLQSESIYKEIRLDFIYEFKKNSIAKTNLLSLMETDLSFKKDVGGMQNLKKWVKKSYGGWTVEGQKFGLPLLKGLLLVGIPGTGKSLISKCIGNEWNLPVINFDPSEIFSSRVGESEANISMALKLVESMAPCILVIDELEKKFSGIQSSTFSDSGVTARVIGSFLTWMEDNTKPIFCIATANDIRILPPELINRFDETFFVNIPGSFERRDIFEIHLLKLKRDPGNFDLDELARNSQKLSGREIEQVLRESMYEAYYNREELTTKIILDVLKKKTNLLTTMAEELSYLYKWVGWDDEKEDGIRARFASPLEDLDLNKIQNEINDILKDIEGKKPGM